jgi:hypothetical protein
MFLLRMSTESDRLAPGEYIVKQSINKRINREVSGPHASQSFNDDKPSKQLNLNAFINKGEIKNCNLPRVR